MSADREALAAVALGIGDAADAAAVGDDPAAQVELARICDAATALALALAPLPPPPYLRAQLLASIGGGRFERFVERFAAMYDLAADRAREVLGWLESPRPWHAPMPGMQFAIFRGGPRYATDDCGILRVAPGATFPWHAHRSDEVSLFLAGAGRDHLGAIYVAGDELTLPAGTAHEFATISADELVVCVRHRGVDFAARRPPPATP